MGSLSATPSQKYQEPFLPMLPGFEYVKFNDLNEFEKAMADDVCAVILEPLQGLFILNVYVFKLLRNTIRRGRYSSRDP